MAGRLVLDSDVVIDYLRRHPAAVSCVRGLNTRPFLSAVTVAELYAGVREGPERAELEAVAIGFRVLPVTRSIATQAGLFRRQFWKSHGVQLFDALIAATAKEIGAGLFTLNLKHYPMLSDVRAPYTKP